MRGSTIEIIGILTIVGAVWVLTYGTGARTSPETKIVREVPVCPTEYEIGYIQDLQDAILLLESHVRYLQQN